MSNASPQTNPLPADAGVRERLLAAAKTCFLAEDYHEVSTRRIAELAQANVSMIRYYFGSKEGLYEEMIRATLNPLLEVLDSEMLATPQGFGDYLGLYYRTMLQAPEFPRLILRWSSSIEVMRRSHPSRFGVLGAPPQLEGAACATTP